jgi:hypothetical protein
MALHRPLITPEDPRLFVGDQVSLTHSGTQRALKSALQAMRNTLASGRREDRWERWQPSFDIDFETTYITAQPIGPLDNGLLTFDV